MATANTNFMENDAPNDSSDESDDSSSDVNPNDPIAAPAAAYSSLPAYVAYRTDGICTFIQQNVMNHMLYHDQDATPLKHASHKQKTPQKIVYGFIREFEVNDSTLSYSIPVSIGEIVLDFYDGPIEFFVLLSCVISKTELYTWNDIWYKSRNRNSLEITVECLISCFIDLHEEILLYRWDREYLQQYIEEMTLFIQDNNKIEGALQRHELCDIVQDFLKHRFDYKDLSAINDADFHDSDDTDSDLLSRLIKM